MWTQKSRHLCRAVAATRHAKPSTAPIRFFASQATLSSTPISVKVSKSEANAGKLDWRNVEIATRALHRDGLVVLEDVIEHEKLDRLNRKMVKDAYALQALGDDGPFNYNKGNIQQDPPLTKQWWDPSIFREFALDTHDKTAPRLEAFVQKASTCLPEHFYVRANASTPDSTTKSEFEASGSVSRPCVLHILAISRSTIAYPIVTQITSTALGPHPRLSFISGNTALPPGAGEPPAAQPTHTDADFDHPPLPFALVVNVPLVTMTPANGSTEVWLGTHAASDLSAQEGRHGERASGRIKRELLEGRRVERGPSQPVVPKGAVVLRDLRLWHGGMPNLTKDPRVMLAMIHFAPWYRNPMFVEFAEELAPLLSGERTGLQVQGTFMPAEEVEKRYLNRPYGNAYDFSQQQPVEGVF